MSSAATTGGVSGTTLLSLLFIALKLTGHIDWSWWWVLAPIWMPAALVMTLGAILFFSMD